MHKNLEEIDETDRAQFGHKAFYLGELLRAGLRVPQGFATLSDCEQNTCFDFSHWAIRSSALDEDCVGQSRTGQYKSYLNATELWPTIQKCFQENRVASVIAQEMIASDYGGVCFSSAIDDTGATAIEFCLGHNSGVTAGNGAVARLILKQDDLVFEDPKGLAKHVSKALLRELGHQARRLESQFGFAVDIEWCVKGEELFFLQARPITGLTTHSEIENLKHGVLNELREQASARGYGLWTDFSIGDMFRNPSRLFLDFVNDDLGEDWSVRRAYRDLGLVPSKKLDAPLFCTVAGRAFIDVGSYFDFLFPSSAIVPTKSGLKVRKGPKSWLATLGHIRRVLFVAPFRVAKLRKRFLLGTQVATDSDQAIYAHLMSDVLAGVSHALVRACLKVLFGKSAQDWEFRLTTGLPGNFNTETTIALFDVAQETMSLDTFMAKFGHRGSPDWDLASKRWREHPSKVLKLVDSMRAAKINPREQFAKQVEVRTEAELQLDQHLKSRWYRKVFASFIWRQIRYLQVLSPLREETQSVVFTDIEATRKEILALAERAGLGEDIFALTKTEFDAIQSGIFDLGELKERIEKRRAKSALELRVCVPHLFDDGDLKNDLFEVQVAVKAGKTLTGVRVSRGSVVGRARVFKELTHEDELTQADIIVAQFVDPSFASKLVAAGGLILEQGSVYSHTAIIAREFGLPAIVNVENATQLIKEGQMLHLKADEGTVLLQDDLPWS